MSRALLIDHRLEQSVPKRTVDVVVGTASVRRLLGITGRQCPL